MNERPDKPIILQLIESSEIIGDFDLLDASFPDQKECEHLVIDKINTGTSFSVAISVVSNCNLGLIIGVTCTGIIIIIILGSLFLHYYRKREIARYNAIGNAAIKSKDFGNIERMKKDLENQCKNIS